MKEVTLVMKMDVTVIVNAEDESKIRPVEEMEQSLCDALEADHLKITDRKIFVRDLVQ